MVKWIKKYRPKSILEIGCGMDPIFTENIIYDSYCVMEPSDKFAENAELLNDGSGRVCVIKDYVENRIGALKKEKFNFIILSGLLHEVKEPDVFLNDVKALLTEKTILHINVPNSHSFHRLLAFESNLISAPNEKSQSNRALQQTTNFDMDSLMNLIDELDLQIVDSGGYFIKPFSHKQMDLLLEYNIIGDEVLDGFEKMIKYIPNLGSEIFVNVMLK